MAHALGIDVGSTNAKVAVVAADGLIAASAAAAIPTRRAGDVAEQDPAALWSAVVEACRAVAAAAPAAAADVRHIGVCSQYSSTVPVDADGAPVADLVLYLDRRGTDHCWALMGRHPEAFELWLDRHGIPPVGSGLSLAHLLHFQLDRPDVHARAAAYLEPMDFVNAQLTGEIAANQCTMFTTQLCDNRRLGVTAYDPELLELSGVDPTRLPPLRPFDVPVGALRDETATELGLPPGATVWAAMNDSHAGAIATNADAPGRAGVMIGTTSVLLDMTTARHATDLDHEVLSMPSPIGDRYVVWAENGLGGKALEHVLRNVVLGSDELGDHLPDDAFLRLDRALDAVPAGSNGLIFLPWLGGSLSPSSNPSMRGAFLNLSLDTHRTDLVRAAVEGVCHNLAWLLPFAEEFAGHPIEEIVFGGGAARSAAWAQILADVLARRVVTLRDPDVAIARATALLALRRAGLFDDAALARLVETERTFEPEPAHRARYAPMHDQFVAAFDALRPLYEALNP